MGLSARATTGVNAPGRSPHPAARFYLRASQVTSAALHPGLFVVKRAVPDAVVSDSNVPTIEGCWIVKTPSRMGISSWETSTLLSSKEQVAPPCLHLTAMDVNTSSDTVNEMGFPWDVVPVQDPFRPVGVEVAPLGDTLAEEVGGVVITVEPVGCEGALGIDERATTLSHRTSVPASEETTYSPMPLNKS